MRKIVSLGLVTLLITAALFDVVAASQDAPQVGSLTGVVKGTNAQAVAGGNVRIRRIDTGEIVSTTTSSPTGEFSFEGLPPGDYVIDVVDASGKVVGMSAPVAMTAGGAPTVSIIAVAGGVLTRSAGGFTLFGLGPVASTAVLGAAGAAAVTAVVATSPDASPSR